MFGLQSIKCFTHIGLFSVIIRERALRKQISCVYTLWLHIECSVCLIMLFLFSRKLQQFWVELMCSQNPWPSLFYSTEHIYSLQILFPAFIGVQCVCFQGMNVFVVIHQQWAVYHCESSCTTHGNLSWWDNSATCPLIIGWLILYFHCDYQHTNTCSVY